MKKKNLKNLSINKSKISNLNKKNIIAGVANINTRYDVCGTGPESILCTVVFTCTHKSVNRC